MPRFRRALKPQSRVFREGTIALAVDGRSCHGRYLSRLRGELTEHVAGPGGKPSTVAAQIIDLAVMDAYQLLLFQERLAESGKLTPRERREESAVRARYERTLRRLGLEAALAKPITADEHIRLLAEREATERAGAGARAA
jgi:hypothetical protein